MILPGYALHHVGLVVPDLAARGSELVARFGYVPVTEAIADPRQTACVQFFLQPGAAHWLELVTPSGPDGKLAGALRKGQTLHHLCYEVPDINASAAHLRSQSMFMVGSPTPAAAFGGRPIAWFLDRSGLLVELVEAGPGPLQLATLNRGL
jgi:methylmalonyl-CoA/ethylmalonyl-CoA epimerase